jgi:AraC family transcriptional regulator of arabinose operon
VIDLALELQPARVSVGTVTYPPGGTLGPRMQADLQLLLVHTGTVRVWVDDAPPRRLAAGQVGLLPDHRERFAFDERTTTCS